MEIISRGPVLGASLLWERNATSVLTVVCTATFELAPGVAVLQTRPDPPLENDIPWEAPYARSLRAISDLVPLKPNVDVLLTGHAYAPGGHPVRSLLARLAVGSVNKSIEVFSDRYFDSAGKLVENRPFARMPLVYERAAGGPSTWNPAGVVIGQRDARGNMPLPNLVPPGTPVLSSERLFIPPVGFGPIPANWPSRVEMLGQRPPREIPAHWRGKSVPDDIAREYFNAAPGDQQLATLREDELITLENLHASLPSLVCRLPGVRPTVTLEGRGAPANVTIRCDTLRIDTDRASCTLVWRGHVPLRQPQEAGRIVVTLDSPARRAPTFSGLERVAGPAIPADSPFEGTMPLSGRAATPALPFGSSAAPPYAAARDPLSQSASTWNDAPSQRAAGRGSAPSFHEGILPPPAPPSVPARDPLSQSASTWGNAVPPPAPPLPPPRERFSSSSWEIAPPAVATAPPPPVAPVPLPPMAPPSTPDSPWAVSAAGAGPVRETIGMAAAVGALALAEPRRELAPLPNEKPMAGAAQEPLQLLWFNPDSVARIRRVPRWKKHLDEFQRKPLDRDLEDADGGKEPWEIEDRREVFEVMARGAPSNAHDVEEALAGAMREDGKLVPPLVLISGEVELPFDELEALRAAANTAAPLIMPADEGLRAAVEAADKFLGRPALTAAPVVCEGLHLKIREAFAREKKGLSGDYLDAQTERVLLTGRHYQKREVFGGTFLRTLVWVAGEKAALVGYVPEELGKKLPMYRRFRGRVIAEVWSQQDQYEAHGLALRVVAVGRVSAATTGSQQR